MPAIRIVQGEHGLSILLVRAQLGNIVIILYSGFIIPCSRGRESRGGTENMTSMITHYLKHTSWLTLLTYMDASIYCWAPFPMPVLFGPADRRLQARAP